MYTVEWEHSIAIMFDKESRRLKFPPEPLDRFSNGRLLELGEGVPRHLVDAVGHDESPRSVPVRDPFQDHLHA